LFGPGHHVGKPVTTPAPGRGRNVPVIYDDHAKPSVLGTELNFAASGRGVLKYIGDRFPDNPECRPSHSTGGGVDFRIDPERYFQPRRDCSVHAPDHCPEGLFYVSASVLRAVVIGNDLT